MAHLSLSLLGPFQVTLHGQPVTGFESNRVRALLAYLAVEADHPHSRDRLAGLLWPEQPDQTAHGNLRQALANLLRAIGDHAALHPFLHIARDHVQFGSCSPRGARGHHGSQQGGRDLLAIMPHLKDSGVLAQILFVHATEEAQKIA